MDEIEEQIRTPFEKMLGHLRL